MKTRYKRLFEKVELSCGLQLKNRIVMAPMTNFSSNDDGTVSDDEIDYYVRRSGGVGMVITACTFVTPKGKGFTGEFAGDRDTMIPSLRRLASSIKAQGSLAVLQIFHAGRMSPPHLVPDGDVVSASAVASAHKDGVVPRALSHEEIEIIIHEFGETTRRAIEAGFNGVEIHGANGYLIHQFFSPQTNRRDDQWGGSLEKRMTFPLAIIHEVKRVVDKHANQPFIVGYRFTPEEAVTPEITMSDTLSLVEKLAVQNLDYLHVSSAELWSLPRNGAEGNKSRMERIQERVDQRVPIIGVGSIRTAEDARKAVEKGIPFIALGRELIMEPDWVKKITDGRESEIKTSLNVDDQERLVIPGPLWQAIIHTPGWFPMD